MYTNAWQLTAHWQGKDIFVTAPDAGEWSPYGSPCYQRTGDDAWRHLTRVLSWQQTADGVHFTVATTEGPSAVANVTFTGPQDNVLRMTVAFPPGPPIGWAACSALLQAKETLLGLGEQFGGIALLDRSIQLWAEDRRAAGYGDATYLPVPWLISSAGFGFLLDDPRETRWRFRTERQDAWRVSVAGDSLNVALIAGQPAEALNRYTALTGRPPAPPAWGLGVVKTLIGGEERVLADAQRLRGDGIPVDGIYVYDCTDDAANMGWPVSTYDAIPPGSYPDPQRLATKLRELGFRPLGYFSPDFRPERTSYATAAQGGYLVRGPDGQPWKHPQFGVSLLDFANPEAVAWWRDGPLRRAVVDLGFDGGMYDLGEAIPLEARFADGQTGATMHNAYPVLMAKGASAALAAWKPDGLFWFRSGYVGAQRYQHGSWSGDPYNNWLPTVGLPSMLPAALGAGLAGYAYWHTEIGGYVDAGLRGASERELFFRWLQFAAFTSMLRDDYGDRRGVPTDIWTDAETLALWRRYAKIHQALRPYLLAAAQQAQATGLPLLRHLALAYPDDPRAWAEQSAYLLGDRVLVAPVVEPGATTHLAYLPRGEWHHWWTSAIFEGPTVALVSAPVDKIPIFVRTDVPSPLPDVGQFAE